MVIHYGATKTSGHYYTLIFNQLDEINCIKADDENMKKIDFDQWFIREKSVNEKPYLMF